MNKLKCYKKSIEGLALYVSELEFKVMPDLHFENDILKRYNKSGDGYEQSILETKIELKPVFSSFYSDNECLIKILIPKTSMLVKAEYFDKSATCNFEIEILKEKFLTLTLSKEEVEQMTLDFQEADDYIREAIEEYCDGQFKNLKEGVMDIKNKWNIICDYYCSHVEIQYS